MNIQPGKCTCTAGKNYKGTKSVIDRLCKVHWRDQFSTSQTLDMASRRVGLSVLGMKIVTQFQQTGCKRMQNVVQGSEVRVPFNTL